MAPVLVSGSWLVLQLAGHDQKCGAWVQDRFVNLIAFSDGDPENQILILGNALLSLSRELHFHPGILQALGVPGELALLGVIVLVGAVSVRGGGNNLFFTRSLTLRCGFWCSCSNTGAGLRTVALHQGYHYPFLGNPKGYGLHSRAYPFRRPYAAPLLPS